MEKQQVINSSGLIRRRSGWAVTLLMLSVYLFAGVARAADNVVVQWNNAALQAIRDTRPGPPMVARGLAIVHTAMYDAWAAYDPLALGTQLGSELRRPASEHTEANKAQALSYAAYRALVDLYPTRRASFDALMASLGYDPADASVDPATPTGVGNRTAAAVLAFRHHDGANQLGDLTPGAYADYTGYAPINTPDTLADPNHWQPLSVPDGSGGFRVQKYVAPHWYKVTPFALTSVAQFRPEPPALFGSAEYAHQAKQVVKLSANLGDNDKAVAEYWADGPASETPPGHWALIAQFVSRRDHHTLDDDAKLFFALTNALLDSSIACWEAKRHYDYVRPISAIRKLYRDQPIRAWGGPGRGTQTILGQNWQPYQPLTFVTPPFAEYMSGHSTFSAAAATVLKKFTGSDSFGAVTLVRAGSSKVEPGIAPGNDVTLYWPTFEAAADEAGLSRRLGGIHFKDGDKAGRRVGKLIGKQTWRKALIYFNTRHARGNADDD